MARNRVTLMSPTHLFLFSPPEKNFDTVQCSLRAPSHTDVIWLVKRDKLGDNCGPGGNIKTVIKTTWDLPGESHQKGS